MYFDSGTPINKRIFEDFEKNLLELIRLSNVEVVAVPYKMAALDGEGDIAQKITSVAPDVLLKISFVPPIIDGGPLVFDVKMLTPDQKKIQWRSLLSGNFTLSDRWAKNLSQKLVVQLRKDGILD
jgi:hypothetical protein